MSYDPMSYLSVDGLFLRAATRFPSRLFVHQLGAQGPPQFYTYAQIASQAEVVARQLRGLGLVTGDRVIIYASDLLPTLTMHLACAFLGVVPAPLGVATSPETVVGAAGYLNAAQVFAAPSRLAALVDRGLRPLCFAEDCGDQVPYGVVHLSRSSTLSQESCFATLQALSTQHGADDVYMLQPTSGTTGSPKFVIRPHAAFHRAASLLGAEVMGPAGTHERVLMLAGLTHGLGQYLLSLTTSVAGTLEVPSALGSACSLEDVRLLDPTILAMPPRVLRSFHEQYCLQSPGRDGRIFADSARALILGGAAPPPMLARLVEQQGVAVVEGYGASECGLLAVTPKGQWREGFAGKIAMDVQLREADDGELLAKTPVLMKGYFGAPDLSRDAFTEDGFYRCGDLCKRSDDGWLQYLGRKRDVFNTNAGNNIYPARIEELVEKIKRVEQCVLVGDQRPYIVALATVEYPSNKGTGRLGYIHPQEAPVLYAEIGSEIAALNAQLEADEKVRRVALFAVPMSESLYSIVGHGKTSRDRKGVLITYSEELQGLYAEPVACGCNVVEQPGSGAD